MYAGFLDHVAIVRTLVAGQIVHDDKSTGKMLGNEALFDMDLESVAIDRAREDQGAFAPFLVNPLAQVEVFKSSDSGGFPKVSFPVRIPMVPESPDFRQCDWP